MAAEYDHGEPSAGTKSETTDTAVRTNIRAQGKKKAASFHCVESWTEVTDEKTGETTGMTLALPDWLFQGIAMRGGVLTIHDDYFLLTGA